MCVVLVSPRAPLWTLVFLNLVLENNKLALVSFSSGQARRSQFLWEPLSGRTNNANRLWFNTEARCYRIGPRRVVFFFFGEMLHLSLFLPVTWEFRLRTSGHRALVILF